MGGETEDKDKANEKEEGDPKEYNIEDLKFQGKPIKIDIVEVSSVPKEFVRKKMRKRNEVKIPTKMKKSVMKLPS